LDGLGRRQTGVEQAQAKLASDQAAALGQLKRDIGDTFAAQLKTITPLLQNVDSGVRIVPRVVSSVDEVKASLADVQTSQEASTLLAPYLSETKNSFRFKVGGGIITLTGVVPNERFRGEVKDLLTSSFGSDRVRDNLKVSRSFR